jgi:hypothetical protein
VGGVLDPVDLVPRGRWQADQRGRLAARVCRSGGSGSYMFVMLCLLPRGWQGMLPWAWSPSLSPVVFLAGRHGLSS